MSGIIELKDYVSKDLTSEIKEAVKPFLPKQKYHEYSRDGYTVNISEITELRDLDAKINNVFINLQKNIIASRYNPSFPSGSSSFEYHMYEAGDICNIHVDNEVVFEKENRSLIRYASVVLHLNTIDSGGELIFPQQNKSIKTEEGKIVVFPPYSMYPHYTTPAQVNREVVVTWFVYTGINAIKI